MNQNINDKPRNDLREDDLYNRAKIETWEYLFAVRVINSQLVPIAHNRQAQLAISWVISVLVDCAMELSEDETVNMPEEIHQKYLSGLDDIPTGT